MVTRSTIRYATAAAGSAGGWCTQSLHALAHPTTAVPIDSSLRLVTEAEEAELLGGDVKASISAADDALFAGF